MKNIFQLLFILFAFSSCETVVTDSITIADSEPLLVVEGGIERINSAQADQQSVFLSTTANFLDNGPKPVVENAIVSISDQSSTYILDHIGNGQYVTDEIVPQLNEVYTLDIQWEGKSYTASDRLNPVPEIDRLYSEFEEETIFTDEGYFLKLDSQDPIGVENFYHYRVYRNDTLINLPDPGNSRSLLISDEFFDGQPRTGINPNEEVIFQIDDKGMVDQMGVSEAYFDFLFEIYELTGNQGAAFVGNPPPASIRGNVTSNNPSEIRALGFFYAADIDRKQIIVGE